MAYSEEVQRILDDMIERADAERLGQTPADRAAGLATGTLVCAFDDSPAAALVSSRHTTCADCGAAIMYRPQNEGGGPEDLLAVRRQGRPAVKRHHRAKLRPAEVRQIRSLFAHGLPMRQIALRFKVTPQTVAQVVSYDTWRHVT